MTHCREHLYLKIVKAAGLTADNKINLQGQGVGDCGNPSCYNSTRYSLTDTMSVVECCFDVTPSIGNLNFTPDGFDIVTNISAVSYISNNITDWEV